MTLDYIHTAPIDKDGNFTFDKLPSGNYYVIVESDSLNSSIKNKNVYIAKNIKLEDDKKIMTVFSKRL